jgi:hypothetical protein
MATCRCPMCGTKKAGRSSTRRHNARYGVGRDERGRSWDYGMDRDRERRLVRRREGQELMRIVAEEA